jgi:hypothetical protein
MYTKNEKPVTQINRRQLINLTKKWVFSSLGNLKTCTTILKGCGNGLALFKPQADKSKKVSYVEMKALCFYYRLSLQERNGIDPHALKQTK